MRTKLLKMFINLLLFLSAHPRPAEVDASHCTFRGCLMINGLLLPTCAVEVSGELWLFLTHRELPAGLERAKTKSCNLSAHSEEPRLMHCVSSSLLTTKLLLTNPQT